MTCCTTGRLQRKNALARDSQRSKNLSMLLLFLTSFVLLQLCLSDMTVLKLEADEGAFTGERIMRGDASGGEIVALKNEQDVSHIFATSSLCEVQVSNVRYSDGSTEDECTVFIAGENVGEFRSTTEPSTDTDQWNEFYNSGTLGSTVLEKGRHLIMVTVNATDEFGVELDFIELGIDCGEDASQSDSSSASGSSLSVGGILGVLAACITLLAAIISACVTLCCCCCK